MLRSCNSETGNYVHLTISKRKTFCGKPVLYLFEALKCNCLDCKIISMILAEQLEDVDYTE
jgi:hypothetical protein